eukprot:scaffold25666_cov101-Isochrysis_galbana.AAC.2
MAPRQLRPEPIEDDMTADTRAQNEDEPAACTVANISLTTGCGGDGGAAMVRRMEAACERRRHEHAEKDQAKRAK